ncbi:hypothetical protein HA402_006147 [Bradysia odoriphaga]|nr:hypothetical protein HA402_006147 [Bradysia odoriphaga]
MQEAQNPDLASYATFNAFFVRPLRDGARPIVAESHVLALPADGAISQLGEIRDDQIFQAKGHNYTLEALLAGNYLLAEPFRNGLFATTYLAPSDYHRVHMPCDGVLREMIYVPGDLFSVNPLTAANVPNLFARNERVICVFDTAFGPMVQILVGATIGGQHRNRPGPVPLRHPAKASSAAGPIQPKAWRARSNWLKVKKWAASNSVLRSSTCSHLAAYSSLRTCTTAP